MHFKIVFSSMFAFLLAAAPGFAQADLKAAVPFDFYAGETPLPAGSYQLDVDNAGLVWISGSAARSRCIVGSIPIGGGPNHGRASKLVFLRYGNEHFLSEMWVSGQPIGRMFRRTPHEDEVARNAGGGQVTMLASRR